jgi:hypothetical protein
MAINENDLRDLQRRAAKLLADARTEQLEHGDSPDGRQTHVRVHPRTQAEIYARKRRLYLVSVLDATVSGIGTYLGS